MDLGYSSREEAFRRMVFNVLAANCDDHTKNTSFILREGQGWKLAPAYDVTFAHNPKGEWTSQHLMSVNGKFKDVTQADLLGVADRFGIGSAARIIRQVSEATGNWPRHARQAGVSQSEADRITQYLQRTV